MFRSLHMKLVIILVLLIMSVMLVVGTFLISSVTSYNIDDFRQQMSSVFKTGFIKALNEKADQPDGAEQIKDVLMAYSGSLGIDSYRSYRNFYILDGKTGDYIDGSNKALGQTLEKTPNILAAVAGKVGDKISFIDSYMDVAVPVRGNSKSYIIYIKDSKQDLKDLTSMLLAITLQAMLFGLIVAVLLSFFLSKTMTTPIEELTKSAALIASGDFEKKLEVHSTDEIGILTSTFNDMAQVLKDTLEEVEGEKNKLNTLFLHMADGVAAFTKEGRLLHMNPAAQKMLGTEFDENLTYKQVFCDLKVPADLDAAEKGYLESDYRKNGRYLKIFFAPFGIPDGGEGLMAVIHDITEQRRLDEAQREFVANVSHELRTPLTNIKSYTETLLENPGDIPPDTETKFLSVISGEADRMMRIVKDLLTLSRLDYARLDLRFSPFSLKVLIQNVYNAMLLEASKNGYIFTLDFQDNLPDMVGDRERIEQVIVNIISNALKYTPVGGTVAVSAGSLKENKVFLKVKDNGIGIPKEDIPRLFERFYRVDKARSRERGGTGLGLAIAKEIVEYHKGRIVIESELDRGTEVTVTLPTNLPLPQLDDNQQDSFPVKPE
ncbi:MAG: ATP-binding protein [Bacillota bacterium]|nr:ATP-binding protein [Bacillota bacterium]